MRSKREQRIYDNGYEDGMIAMMEEVRDYMEVCKKHGIRPEPNAIKKVMESFYDVQILEDERSKWN